MLTRVAADPRKQSELHTKLVLFAWANDIPVELQFNVATTHERRLLKSK